MVKFLPGILRKFRAKPKALLDLACGDGRFAVLMAKRGLMVTGVDSSTQMLKYAQKRANKAGVKVDFCHQKMQSLFTEKKFDLVTCWFDSLNYLLAKRELCKTFKNVSNVLNNNGLFIFDMNTVYGLSVCWQKRSPGLLQNTKDMFEVHHDCQYDFRKNIARLKITGFFKKGRMWKQIEEIHQERGYKLNEIRQCLYRAKLKELACWGDMQKMTKPKRKSGRVWFVVKRR
jgi:ubiquinone/menaquinone biosynthesis C-methylase UbiE